MALTPGKRIKPKRKCCQSRPRCKRCPVVLARLEDQGLVERRKNGAFTVIERVNKKRLKAARA
jgi:hypothetical protein